MRNKKVYSPDTVKALKAEVIRFRDEQRKTVTLDKVLLQSKKEAAELINIGCNAKEITRIYKNAGIQVSLAKIRQAYFADIIKKRAMQTPKVQSAENN